MSDDLVKQTVIVATMPAGVETAAYMARLLHRHKRRDLGRNIAFDWEYAPSFELSSLIEIVRLPWRGDGSYYLIRAKEIATARATCAKLVPDLDRLAAIICELTDADERADVRAFLEDETGLLQSLDGETEARRLAQVFAAVVRTLRRAAKHERGLIVVHAELDDP